jgi:hypothetical protein
MTTPSRTGAYTGAFRDQRGGALAAGMDGAVAAAAVGDWKHAAAGAAQVQAGALHLHHSIVRDALAGGLDWWAIGELLAMHPQAAFEQYANLADDTVTPARQRPPLAVTCTAGLAARHDMEPWFGIDIDDLDPGHSLTADPTVARLRETAAMLGEDIWVAVKLPGQHQGDDDLEDGTAARRWTTVVLHPDELGWLREALALNAEGGDPDIDDDECRPAAPGLPGT